MRRGVFVRPEWTNCWHEAIRPFRLITNLDRSQETSGDRVELLAQLCEVSVFCLPNQQVGPAFVAETADSPGYEVFFRQEYSDIDAESVSEDIAVSTPDRFGFDLDFFCRGFPRNRENPQFLPRRQDLPVDLAGRKPRLRAVERGVRRDHPKSLGCDQD